MKPENRRTLGNLVASVATVLAIVGVILLAVALAACQPVKGTGEDPCAPGGCQVPNAPSVRPAAASGPLYVPQCQDVDAGHRTGCVGQVGDSGMWIYTPTGGGQWPEGRTIDLCPTEDGGPTACAWLPSVQGNDQGDSGAYVYGIDKN